MESLKGVVLRLLAVFLELQNTATSAPAEVLPRDGAETTSSSSYPENIDRLISAALLLLINTT